MYNSTTQYVIIPKIILRWFTNHIVRNRYTVYKCSVYKTTNTLQSFEYKIQKVLIVIPTIITNESY